MKRHSFTIRAYGVLINQQKEVLLTDEWIQGKLITKFPGGGLEWGEGLLDCLKREFREELHLDISSANIEHLYTTDFFQPSFLNPTIQVISVYYKITEAEVPDINAISRATPQNNSLQPQKFRWLPVRLLTESLLSLPIDRYVIRHYYNRLII